MTSRLFAAVFAVCFAPLAARAADDDNPYKTTKVGDYVTFKMTMKVAGQNVTGTLTRTVTAKSDKEATVKSTGKFSLGGKDMDIPATEEKIDLTKPFDPAKLGGPGALPAGVEATIEKGKDGKEKIKVGGKEYDCTWSTYKIKAKAMGVEVSSDAKTWLSKDIPMGLAKMESTSDALGMKIEMTLEFTESGSKKQ